jgi:hypothetical protein
MVATNKDFKVKSGLQLGGSINLVNGVAPTNGQLLIGNTTNSDFDVATLTAGTGISVTNSAGGITLGLTNNAFTLGSTSISLGSTATTLAGLSSVTATTFVGALTGNATNITGTYAGTITSSQVTTGLGYTPFNPTPSNAVNSLLPTQTGNNQKFLRTNGSAVEWATVSTGGSFEGVFDGAVTGPVTGTKRKYLGTSFTLTKITGHVNVAGIDDVIVSLNKNGNPVGTLTILAGNTSATATISVAIIADTDYVTMDITSGTATDLIVRVDYS